MPPQNHEENSNFEPDVDLLSEHKYCNICVPLRKAAIEGNWKAATRILEKNSLNRSDIPCKAITRGHATILHVAAGARQINFVREIINSIAQNDDRPLLLQDKKGNNAFCFAAAGGEVKLAELMHNRNPRLNLANVPGGEEKTPLYMALMFGRNDMAKYLYGLTSITSYAPLKDLFFRSITTGLYGFAQQLLTEYPQLAGARDLNNTDPQPLEAYETALHMLARMSMTSDALNLVKNLWEVIKLEPYEIVRKIITRPKNLLFDAAEAGNSKFLAVVVRSYPDLIHILDTNNLSIFHIAVSHRHANVFNLIYEMGFDKELLASYVGINDGNNMLHLAAKYPASPPTIMVQGAALEFQQELLMFQEVEMIMQPSLRDQKNKELGHNTPTEGNSSPTDSRSSHTESHSSIGTSTDGSMTIKGYTPKELFTMTHKDLKEKGEKWMKGTAKSCMLVATLIATVVFAAAFSVPGGNSEQTGSPLPSGNNEQAGIPIHLHKTFFKVFAASDAIALLFSSLSILFFLSILTSRYEEKDFRMWLPLKLILGLLTLFISVIAMTLAFSSAFFLFYNESWNGITGLTFAVICVAAIVHLVLHLFLLKDTIRSTFCSKNQIKTKRLPV